MQYGVDKNGAMVGLRNNLSLRLWALQHGGGELCQMEDCAKRAAGFGYYRGKAVQVDIRLILG